MSIYVINYYLRETETHTHSCGCGDDKCGCHDDPAYDIIGEIESLGAWAQFTPSSFLVHSEYSSEEILSKLKAAINDKDIVFVSKVTSEFTECTLPQVKEWITVKENTI